MEILFRRSKDLVVFTSTNGQNCLIKLRMISLYQLLVVLLVKASLNSYFDEESRHFTSCPDFTVAMTISFLAKSSTVQFPGMPV